MAFWNKVKDFIGIEDDYIEEDEYSYEDDDYDFSDTEKVDYNENVKKEETTYQNKMEEKPYRSTESRITQRPSSTETKNVRSYGANKNMIVSIKEPLTYEDSKTVIDDIKDKKTVVLNLEMLEMDKKTQIFYFVSGGVYALNGSIQNVTKDIYVLVPEGVEVDSKLRDTISEKSLYQL